MKDLISRYFEAFANLYGIIPMKRAYRIIEKQNPELNLTKEKFAEIVNGLEIPDFYYVIWSEREVYGENADEADLFDKFLIADYIITFGEAKTRKLNKNRVVFLTLCLIEFRLYQEYNIIELLRQAASV